MRIILARPRGFCAGVNMAVETLDRYGATFEERPVREETMQFQLPPELRALAGRGRD